MSRKLNFLLLCGGIFVCGVVAGGFGARHIWDAPRPPENFGPRTLQKLVKELSLTEAQRATIEPAIMRSAEELRRLRRESWKQSGAVIEAMDQEVLASLTPEQRVHFAELKTAQRARIQAATDERQRRRAENEPERREGGGRQTPPAKSPEDSR